MRIVLSAGEPSGDRIGAELARALRRQDPRIELAGAAGPLMREAGVRPLADADDFAHSGWSSVAVALPWLVLRAVAYFARVRAFAPQAAVAVDAPGLHAPFLRRLAHLDRARTWVAPPQLWAWKDRRPKLLRGLRVHPLHRFEVDSLLEAGADCAWLGFPLPRPVPRRGARDAIALFPGSRAPWRRRHARLFLEAARAGAPWLRPVFAHPRAREGGFELGVPVVAPERALERAVAAIAMPGSATLDIALEGIPGVVAAKPGRVDSWIARRRLAPGPLALPNRILGRPVYAEFADPDLRASDLVPAVSDCASGSGVEPALAELRDLLGPPDAASRIAESILAEARRGT